MKFNMRFFILFFSLAWCGCPITFAQKAENEKAMAQVSIIAIGPVPSRRFSNPSGGAPRMLPPLQGQRPPANLLYKSDGSSGGEIGYRSVHLPYNRATPFIKIPVGKEMVFYVRDGKDEVREYFKIPAFTPGSQHLIVLSSVDTNQHKAPWSLVPKVSCIAVNTPELFNKQLYFLNFSSHQVTFRVAAKSYILNQSGGHALAIDRRKKLHPVHASYGDHRVLFSTAIRQPPKDSLHLILFYNANARTNSGHLVGTYRTVIQLSNKEPKSQPN